MPFLPIIGPIISGISGIFEKREERKTVKATAEAKLAQAKLAGEEKITLTDAEWESISARGLAESWKDEYVTIIVTAPIVGILAGAVWAAIFGDRALLDGTLDGVRELKELGLDWNVLTTAVVFAAIGLKMWRAK